MARSGDMFNFVEIEMFELLVLTLVFLTKLFNVMAVTSTAELADYFFDDVPTDVFAVIGLFLLLLLLHNLFEDLDVVDLGLVDSVGDVDDEWTLLLCLYLLAEHAAEDEHGIVGTRAGEVVEHARSVHDR
jgi:hypothetical protein